jgi:hypothetical protein
MLCGDLAVMQAPGLDSLSFDPFSLFQDGLSPSEVDIGRGQIIDALVIAVGVVVIHEGFNAGLKISGEEVVLQQDAVVPSFNLALGLGVIRCAPDMAHALVLQPISQITGDVAGTVVRSQPEAFKASSSVSLTSSAFIDVHSFQAMI